MLAELEFERDVHPVDLIEYVASRNKWEFDRSSDDEISLTVAGNWTDYNVSLSWMEDFETLHMACAFDMKVPENRVLEVTRLLSLINEQLLLIGHFDLWAKEGVVMFRQTLLLNGGAAPTGEQLECLMASAWKLVSVIIRLSSSWYGQETQPKNRLTVPFSKPCGTA